MRTFLIWILRLFVKPIYSPWVPLFLQRSIVSISGRAIRAPRGTSSNDISMNGVPARKIDSQSTDPDRVILYFHGGGYVFGGSGSHGNAVAHLGSRTGAVIFFPLYRLAPENPYPAALDDATASYRWLLDQGYDPGRIVIAGDSAGGGLAAATLVSIRDAGWPLPIAAVLLSPFLDLSLSGRSMQERVKRDPLLKPAYLRWCSLNYRQGRPAEDPGCSPLFADLKGLPPLLIQVGSEEVLYSDSEQLAARARSSGVSAEFRCYKGMYHDFQLYSGLIKEAEAAINDISDFCGQQWNSTDTDTRKIKE